MRITNRFVSSVVFLLTTGVLLTFGMTGCEPRTSGGATPPAPPRLDLPAPTSPAASTAESPAGTSAAPEEQPAE